MEEFFGPVISRYSRAQAIEDGVLVDVSKMAREAGFKFSVAISQALWSGVIEPSKYQKERNFQSVEGRLWDCLNMLMFAIRRGQRGSEVRFSALFLQGRQRSNPKLVSMKALCGPGDDGEPVITIMFPNED